MIEVPKPMMPPSVPATSPRSEDESEFHPRLCWASPASGKKTKTRALEKAVAMLKKSGTRTTPGRAHCRPRACQGWGRVKRRAGTSTAGGATPARAFQRGSNNDEIDTGPTARHPAGGHRRHLLQRLVAGRPAIARGTAGLHQRRHQLFARRGTGLGACRHQPAPGHRRPPVGQRGRARRTADGQRRHSRRGQHQSHAAESGRPHRPGAVVAGHIEHSRAAPGPRPGVRDRHAQPGLFHPPPRQLPHRRRSGRRGDHRDRPQGAGRGVRRTRGLHHRAKARPIASTAAACATTRRSL